MNQPSAVRPRWHYALTLAPITLVAGLLSSELIRPTTSFGGPGPSTWTVLGFFALGLAISGSGVHVLQVTR